MVSWVNSYSFEDTAINRTQQENGLLQNNHKHFVIAPVTDGRFSRMSLQWHAVAFQKITNLFAVSLNVNVIGSVRSTRVEPLRPWLGDGPKLIKPFDLTRLADIRKLNTPTEVFFCHCCLLFSCGSATIFVSMCLSEMVWWFPGTPTPWASFIYSSQGTYVNSLEQAHVSSQFWYWRGNISQCAIRWLMQFWCQNCLRCAERIFGACQLWGRYWRFIVDQAVW